MSSILRSSLVHAVHLLSVALAISLSAQVASAQGPAGSGQADPFYGTFQQSVPISVPPYHGIAPELALSYSSSTAYGWVGTGWSLAGMSWVERMSPGKGAPTYTSSDIFVLDGQELIPCGTGSVSPSCTTGGTHSTKIESYARIKRDTTANTWTIMIVLTRPARTESAGQPGAFCVGPHQVSRFGQQVLHPILLKVFELREPWTFIASHHHDSAMSEHFRDTVAAVFVIALLLAFGDLAELALSKGLLGPRPPMDVAASDPAVFGGTVQVP